jgi:hypothetical protein
VIKIVNPKPETETDFLAVVSFGTLGSFARNPDRAAAIEHVGRLVRCDWDSMLELPEVVKATVVNVAGFERVVWDATSFHGFTKDKPDEGIAIDPAKIEVVDVTLPPAKRRKARR